MMSPTLRILLALSALSPAAAPLATEPDATRDLAIVDRSIAFHGGGRYRSSVTSLDVCSKSGCYGVTAAIDGGRYTLEATHQSRDRHRRVRIDNDTVSAWRDGHPEPVSPADARRHRDWVMQRVYFAFLPYRLNDPSVWKQDLGIETWDGRPLHKVKVTFTPGSSTDADDAFMYWFEPESGRLIQLAYSYDGAPGGLRFRKAVKPRRIGGILFFDQENYGAEGDRLQVEDITPAFAAAMPLVSTVRLGSISVRALDR